MEQKQHVEEIIGNLKFDKNDFRDTIQLPRKLYYHLQRFCHMNKNIDYKNEVARAIYLYLKMNNYQFNMDDSIDWNTGFDENEFDIKEIFDIDETGLNNWFMTLADAADTFRKHVRCGHKGDKAIIRDIFESSDFMERGVAKIDGKQTRVIKNIKPKQITADN